MHLLLNFDEDVLFSSLDQDPPYAQDPLPTLLKAGSIIVQDEGTLTLRGELARFHQGINRMVQAFAESLQAEEVILPGSLSLTNFRRIGYLERFPQFATLISHLHEEPQKVCTSAICLTSYPIFEGRNWAEGENLSLTAFGKAFRREDFDSSKPERLSEFSMREIIFLGSEEFVMDSLAKCATWMKQLVIDCGLQGVIQSAEDPFFCPDAEKLKAYQKFARSKFELCLVKPTTQEKVAVASINNHATHFSKTYKITRSNRDFIHTGCFGLGIERFLLMILHQHGPDTTRWPDRLKALI